MNDSYGRPIVDNGDGTYSIDGVTIAGIDLDHAIAVFDSMPPIDDNTPQQQPLDPVGALATLLVVVGTLNVVDAANAVRLTPADLVAEAEAWAAAAP